MTVTDKMLEENTTPFGLLPKEMQRSFSGCLPEELERFSANGWVDVTAIIRTTTATYRKKPVPKVGLNIPWDYLGKEWRYAAMDKEGVFTSIKTNQY